MRLQADCPKSELTLSAVAELRPEDARVAAVLAQRLEDIEGAPPALRAGMRDALIAYVFGPAVFSAAERQARWPVQG